MWWRNIYTKKTISNLKYLKLPNAEKRNWRRVHNSEQSSSSILETTTPSTGTWIDIGDIFSSDDNNRSNNDKNPSNDNSLNSDNSSSSTDFDFGGGDFGGGGAGGDW